MRGAGTIWLIAVAALAGCGDNGPADVQEANTVEAAPLPAAGNAGEPIQNVAAAAPAVDLAAARALVTRIYDGYVNQKPGDEDVFTPEIIRLIEKAEDDGGLGYDAFCNCQDFGQFSYTIDSFEATPQGAVAKVSFRNFGEPYKVTLDLVQVGGNWRVDDVHDGQSSMRAALR